jgi:hypothetical protein
MTALSINDYILAQAQVPRGPYGPLGPVVPFHITSRATAPRGASLALPCRFPLVTPAPAKREFHSSLERNSRGYHTTSAPSPTSCWCCGGFTTRTATMIVCQARGFQCGGTERSCRGGCGKPQRECRSAECLRLALARFDAPRRSA